MILILEDDLEQAFLLRTFLARLLGERCLATASLMEAESRMMAGEVSLLVSDLRLGDRSGVELFRRLHAHPRTHAPPMVVFTGLSSQDPEFREASYYTDAIFEKGGTSIAKLGEVIQNLLGRLPA
jgi:DNA-binding response OmpR family regulator